MHKFVLILLIMGGLSDTPSTEITWETLSDVRFTDKYSAEVDAYYYYPHFGLKVMALEGKRVHIKGHILIVDPKEDFYILSKYPYSSCFFCGNGGPESIVELKLNPDHPKFKTDQVLTFEGKLKLNKDDINQCNYILEDAKVYDE